MTGRRLKGLLLGLLAVVAAGGALGATYACYSPPYVPPSLPKVDLKICDQDEGWGDGVFKTWTVTGMAPGQEFAFTGCFVGLKNRYGRGLSGSISISCTYNPYQPSQPDGMARYMVITRAVYTVPDGALSWQVDLLTGRAKKTAKSQEIHFPPNDDWRLRDADGDGRLTFADLKKRPIRGLPLPAGGEAFFEMGVKFHEAAANELQGEAFSLTMVYNLSS